MLWISAWVFPQNPRFFRKIVVFYLFLYAYMHLLLNTLYGVRTPVLGLRPSAQNRLPGPGRRQPACVRQGPCCAWSWPAWGPVCAQGKNCTGSSFSATRDYNLWDNRTRAAYNRHPAGEPAAHAQKIRREHTYAWKNKSGSNNSKAMVLAPGFTRPGPLWLWRACPCRAARPLW